MILQITFEQILPFWKKLWPNRASPIRPTNPIDYMGVWNPQLEKVTPTFFALMELGVVFGVNSLHPSTTDWLCRSRGIWIQENARFQNAGRELMTFTENEAARQGFKYIWSMPRKEAFGFYQKMGYKQTTDFSDDYEFGPNCFVLKRIGG